MNFDYTLNNLKNDRFIIESLYSKKFDVFRIKNFLDENSFNYINQNFPKLQKNRYKENFLKYSISSNTKEYKRLLLYNFNLKKINEFFTDEKFSSFFLKKFFFKIVKARINDGLHFKRMFLKQNFGSPQKSIFVSNLETRVEFSFLTNNAVINPHTDAVKKMISLMLYFPDEKSKFSLENQKKFGTQFWSSKTKNFKNKHIEETSQIENFFKNNDIVCSTAFEKYHLYGFIRNSLSWHSVNKILADENFIRRSININIFFI